MEQEPFRSVFPALGANEIEQRQMEFQVLETGRTKTLAICGVGGAVFGLTSCHLTPLYLLR